jgi:hypothetical protein
MVENAGKVLEMSKKKIDTKRSSRYINSSHPPLSKLQRLRCN